MSLPTWTRLALVLVVALILQVSLLDQVVVFGAHPDLMVLIPAAAGLAGGSQRGAVIGFVAGLLADLVVQLPYGLSPLTFVIAGFAAGLLITVPLGRDLPSAELLICALLGVATSALYAIIGALIGQAGLLTVDTLRSLVVVALGGLVLSYPLLRSIRWCFVGAGPRSAYSVPSGGSALG